MANTERNKQLVMTAYQRIFGDFDFLAINEFISKDFIQHNPTIAEGPNGVKALIETLSSQGVKKQQISFKHVVAEDDLVFLHSRYEMAGKEWRFIDIYRIENDKLAEHWDAMMPMPDERANPNQMF